MTNPKHTDTSRSGDLVERLRLRKTLSERIEALETQLESANEALRERLDICETQAREIERLRMAVADLADNITEWDGVNPKTEYTIDLTRAALAGDSHDQ